MRNEKTNPGGTVFNRTRQCLLLYADDMVVLESTVQHVAETAEDITTAASQISLTINVSKIRYMINIKKRGTELEEIEVNGWRY